MPFSFFVFIACSIRAGGRVRLFVTIAREHFSLHRFRRRKSLKKTPARVRRNQRRTKEETFFFQLSEEVARPRGRSLARGASLLSPPCFCGGLLFRSVLALSLSFSREPQKFSSRLNSYPRSFFFLKKKRRERLLLLGTPRREPGQPPSSSAPAPAVSRSAKAPPSRCAPRGGLQRSTGGALRSPGVEAKTAAARTAVAPAVAATELLPRDDPVLGTRKGRRGRADTNHFLCMFLSFTLRTRKRARST